MQYSESIPVIEGRNKKEAAGLLHEYLRDVLKEPDLKDISRASVLRDLYDCGVCVNAIAQMFLKGIMIPQSERIFGLEEILTEKEADAIIYRLLHQDNRNVPIFAQYNSVPEGIREDTFRRLEDPILVDVRSVKAYDNGHRKGAVNLPLSALALNPHLLGNDLYKTYVFYCEEGSRAKLACEFALQAGYRRIFYLEI